MKQAKLKTCKRVSKLLIIKINFMKKSVVIMSLAFALATASAFTVRVNPTGFKKVGSTVFSGQTDNANCQVQSTGTLCTIVVNEAPVSPVYSTSLGATNETSSVIMRH